MNLSANENKLVSIKRFIDDLNNKQRYEERMRDIEASLRRREQGFDLGNKKYENDTELAREVRKFHAKRQLVQLPSEFLSLRSNNRVSTEHFLPFLSDKELKLELESDRKKYYLEVLLHHPAKPELVPIVRRLPRSKSVF